MAVIPTVDRLKIELRIGGRTAEKRAAYTAHDDLLATHIAAATSFVEGFTGPVTDESPDALGQAIVLAARAFYNGFPDVRGNAAFFAILAPYRRV